MSTGGLKFAGFADFEGRFEGRWRTLRDRIGDLFFQWEHGCLEENIIPMIPRAHIFRFIEDPAAEKTSMRLRTLADRLGIGSADFDVIAAERTDEELVALIVAAATGQIPEHLADAAKAVKNPYKGHSAVWFKSEKGGRELAEKVREVGSWPRLQAKMNPFLNAIRASVGLEPLPEAEQ